MKNQGLIIIIIHDTIFESKQKKLKIQVPILMLIENLRTKIAILKLLKVKLSEYLFNRVNVQKWPYSLRQVHVQVTLNII